MIIPTMVSPRTVLPDESRVLRAKVMSSILTGALLCVLMERILLRRMRTDALEMVRPPILSPIYLEPGQPVGKIRYDSSISPVHASSFVRTLQWNPHQAHLDPSDIISEPLPLQAVSRYVLSSVIAIFSVSFAASNLFCGAGGGGGLRPSHLLRCAATSGFGISLGGALVFAAAVLCGASPVDGASRTLLASLYVSGLGLGPVLASSSGPGTSPLLPRLLAGAAAPASRSSVADRCGLIGTAAGIVPLMVLRVLDAGIQAQRNPFPVLAGSSLGCAAGTGIGLLAAYCALRPTAPQGWQELRR